VLLFPPTPWVEDVVDETDAPIPVDSEAEAPSPDAPPAAAKGVEFEEELLLLIPARKEKDAKLLDFGKQGLLFMPERRKPPPDALLEDAREKKELAPRKLLIMFSISI
jgi:hypothetical protein